MFRQRAYVELADGTTVSLQALTQRVPSTLRRSDEHIKLCEWVANRSTLDDDERRVYINQLVVHSDALYGLSALAFLLKHQAISVTRLNVPMQIPEPIRQEFSNLISQPTKRQSPNYLGWKTRLKTLVKILGHVSFRLIGRRIPQTEKAIRSYVEDSLKNYQEHMHDAAVLVYPFKTSILRQWRFLSNQRAEGRTVHLIGFSYRWLDALRVIFAGNAPDETLIRIETAAVERHGDELVARGIREVYSCADSETTGWAFNRRLNQRGVKTYNIVHGVGVYGPYLCFEHGSFLNQKQWDYYRPRSQITHVTLLREREPSLDDRPCRAASCKAPTAIVVLRGNWENVGKIFEWRFEEEVAEVAARIAVDLGLTLWIKFHPNTKNSIRQQICAKHCARELPALDSDQVGDYPIFINTLSTAYYTARMFGPVIFVQHPWQDPRDMFGDQIEVTTMNHLPEVIRAMHSAWQTESAVRDIDLNRGKD